MNDFFKDHCEVVRDLLPIYADHGTSPKTTALIAQHIAKCDSCSKYLRYIKQCNENRRAAIRAEIAPDYNKFIKAVKRKRNLHKAMVTVSLAASFSALIATAVIHSRDTVAKK